MPRGTESLSWNTTVFYGTLDTEYPRLTSIVKDFLSNVFIPVQKQCIALITAFSV